MAWNHLWNGLYFSWINFINKTVDEMIYLRPINIQITSATMYQLILIYRTDYYFPLHCARYKLLPITWKEKKKKKMLHVKKFWNPLFNWWRSPTSLSKLKTLLSCIWRQRILFSQLLISNSLLSVLLLRYYFSVVLISIQLAVVRWNSTRNR